MKKHFVTFYSPGTLFAEETIEEIDSWDVEKAKKMGESITERYDAIPYGFQFTTRSRGVDDLDSKISDTSGMYYINCVIQTLDEIKAQNNPDNRILIRNMERNNHDKIVTTVKGWKFTQPLTEDDTVL